MIAARVACVLAGTIALAGAVGAQPIASSADLDRYLAHVAPGESPLDRLSAPAKRRFLAAFREGRLSTAELQAELTREDARAVLALFGYERFVPTHLRAQYLAIGASETPDASARFDAIDKAAYASDAREAVADEYRRLYAPEETDAALRRLSDGDLALSFRAASKLAETDPDADMRDLLVDLAELERRGVAAPGWIADTYGLFMLHRDFAGAQTFRGRHPDTGLPPLPKLRDESNGHVPTVLVRDDDGALVRRAVSIDPRAQVIVVAGCHFSKDAAEAIEADPVLRPLFSRNTLWISPASEDPADPDLARWNREHPLAAMSTAWRASEWPAIDTWAMPTFYFLRDGRVAAKVVGWQDHRDAVLAGFRTIGLAR